MGVAAKFAEAYSQHYESPKEFLHVDCLALIGAAISGRVRADFDVPCQPRMYLLKVGPSAWDRKSTSTRFADKFIRQALGPAHLRLVANAPPANSAARVVYGVGSAEGLAQFLQPDKGTVTRRVVVIFDEFRRFEGKAFIDGSVLRAMVNELYESNVYDNATRDRTISIREGHLTFLSNSTDKTYRNLLNASEFRDMGFLNRLLIVVSNSNKRVAQPKAPPEKVLEPIRAELRGYFDALPVLNPDGSASREVVIPLTPAAKKIWQEWYYSLPRTDDTARLDNLGMRLMALLAFTSGQSEVDDKLLYAVLQILDYEWQVRRIYKPIEAETLSGRVEQAIRNQLHQRGPLSRRNLRRHTNADRYGLKAFDAALESLEEHGEIRIEGGKVALSSNEEEGT